METVWYITCNVPVERLPDPPFSKFVVYNDKYTYTMHSMEDLEIAKDYLEGIKEEYETFYLDIDEDGWVWV